MRRPNLRTCTTAWVALMVPTTIVVATATAAYFKGTNPDNVDITQGLAYLEQTIIAGVITIGIFIAVSAWAIVRMYRRDHDFSNAKLPLVLLIATIVLMFGASVINSYTNQVQNKYLTDHGRPTLQQFFEQMKK